MSSKTQSAELRKGESNTASLAKRQIFESKSMIPTISSQKKNMRFTSASEKDLSSAIIDEDGESTCGISIMSRVVKRKIHKVKPIIEYNKKERLHGKAAHEMQSYICVLACTKVPLVDMKWTKLNKDVKERVWEVVEMAYEVGQYGKKMVLSSVAKKWKDFKSTLMRQFILPFVDDLERLQQPTRLYNFIDQSQWKPFVALRLSLEFEAVQLKQKQRREMCEYNYRLSQKGYTGLEDQLEETMSGEEIDYSLIWKKAREDKQGNISNPKAGEKDELRKQISDVTLTVSGSYDVLTMTLGTPEHGGKVRGVGTGVFHGQYFNMSRQWRVRFEDKLKKSVMESVREESLKIEDRAQEKIMKAVRAERKFMLKQFCQLIPNFDRSMLKAPTPTSKTPIR